MLPNSTGTTAFRLPCTFTASPLRMRVFPHKKCPHVSEGIFTSFLPAGGLVFRKSLLLPVLHHPQSCPTVDDEALAKADSYETLVRDRKSTRLNSSHPSISYAVLCLKKKKKIKYQT